MGRARDILVEAMEDIKEAQVPTELWPVVLPKTIEVLAGIGTVQGAPGPALAVPPGGGAAGSGADGGIAGIASRLALSTDVVSEVFEISDGRLDIVVSTARLPTRQAAATKEIALLIVAGNMAAGLKEWTPASEIREVCDAHRRLDSSNFASTMAEMHEPFRARGTPRQREYSMSKPGWEQAKALVARLSGGA